MLDQRETWVTVCLLPLLRLLLLNVREYCRVITNQFINNLESVRMYAIHESLKNKPKCRVELHIHLDGSLRFETIWELLRQKNLPLPGNGSLKDLKDSLHVGEPKDLYHFLKSFQIFMPVLIDDLNAIERVSYEFVEDQARESVLYCEARLCPHLLLSKCLSSSSEAKEEETNGEAVEKKDEKEDVPRAKEEELEDTSEGLQEKGETVLEITEENAPNKNEECAEQTEDPKNDLTVDAVMEACLRGLRRGEEQFGTKVRLILCCIRKRTQWSWDILRLCEKYNGRGVVGIDLAGDDASDEEFNNEQEVVIFQMAKEKGIHITVHAGEEGGSHEIKKALSLLNAERIGHGYHVLDDEELYQKCLEDRVHFEMCPHSSYLTGSIKKLKLESKRHPILRLAEDGASFSINTDDPTCTGTWMGDEYRLLQTWGFTEAHFTKANFEAAARCFLPPQEKEQLLCLLREAYGIPTPPTTPISPTPSLVAPSISPPPSITPPLELPSTPVEKSGKRNTVAVKPEFKIASWEDRSSK